MLHELRLAVRSLKSWRFGATAAVLTLAVGIGAATSMYAFLRSALNNLPQIEDVEAVGRIYMSSRTLGVERSQLSLADVAALAGASSFEGVAAYTSETDDVGTAHGTVTASVGEASPALFTVMRTRPETGRSFSAADGPNVAVVSTAFWQAHFTGAALENPTVSVSGLPRTIVGVLPREFDASFIGISADVWLPISPGADASRRRVGVIARLRPDRTWATAAAELGGLAKSRDASGLWTWSAIPVQDDVHKRTGGGLAMIFGPALVVLLIGCTNVASMLLARGVDREVEFSVRGALGATRARIVRQLVVEHAILGIAGGALGWALAVGILRWIASQMAAFQPASAARLPGDLALLPASAGFSIVACVLFGALPALRLSRRDVTAALKGTAPPQGRFVGYRGRDLVVFVEVAFAVGLIVTTAMWVKLFSELQDVRPLFPAKQIVAVSVAATDAAAARERIASVPGVASVSYGSSLPGGRAAEAAHVRAASGRATRVAVVRVERDYFRTMGLALARGRAFDRSESRPQSPVAVVTTSAAELLWPGADPLGERLTISGSSGPLDVVVIGVSADALRLGALLRAGIAAPDIYLPFDAVASTNAVVVASAAGDAHMLVKPIGAAAAPNDVRPPRARVLDDDAVFVHKDSTFIVRLFGGFGLLALILAASGIYGVVSQSVAQRTTEFGVRMAMGASAARVLRMVVAREGKLIAAAILSGAAVTLAITRSAFVELLVISAPDPRVWAGVMGLCGSLAVLAVGFATWRIVRLDPWVVLKGNR